MTVNLSALAGAGQQFFDDNGVPLSGGKLYSYVAGTTTPQATYTSASGATLHANPIILNAAGRVATGEIWLTAGQNYKFLLNTSADVLIATWDNITGINGTGITTAASSVSFTGANGLTGTVQDIADSDGSDWIGYKNGSATAVSTTVQTKLRETVSVEDFGAVGNGIADDTSAFNLAIAATKGEILLDPTKTYAVNLVITKRGTRLNGRGGDNIAVAGTPNKSLIPFDPTKPVIQIAEDAAYVGGCVIENLSIWSQSPSGTHGTIGIYLAGGAYGNYIQNVQIGNSFSQHNLKLLGGATYANSYNQITNIQLWTLANVNQIATFASYYGGSFCTANYLSNFNITGPSGTGTGYAVLIDSVSMYMSSGWIEAATNCGILFQKTWAPFPTLLGNALIVDSVSTTDVLLTSAVASDTFTLPINFIKGSLTVDGKFKNAAGTSTAIPYAQYVPNDSLITFPIIYGAPRGYNATTTDTPSIAAVFGANNNITFGDSTVVGYGMLLGGTGGVYLAPGGTSVAQAYSGGFKPVPDNTLNLGAAAQRWATVYAGTGTINTSDEREKQDVEELSEAEKRVAVALKGLVKKFRFKDAVQAKGDAARIHVGVIAQEVVAAFAAEGLDPMRYAIICYDEWAAEEAVLDEAGAVVTPAKSAGNRYGVRYEELLAFIVSTL